MLLTSCVTPGAAPSPEVVALLCCRCPGFLRVLGNARHSLALESAYPFEVVLFFVGCVRSCIIWFFFLFYFHVGKRKLDCNIAMAVTILKSMHSNILEVEITNSQAVAGVFLGQVFQNMRRLMQEGTVHL